MQSAGLMTLGLDNSHLDGRRRAIPRTDRNGAAAAQAAHRTGNNVGVAAAIAIAAAAAAGGRHVAGTANTGIR